MIDELIRAVIASDIDKVKEILENGIDVNIRNRYGDLPIYYAQNKEIVQLLIKNGADVNLPNNIGSTFIFYARDTEVVELLIESGADVNFKEKWSGFTLLHHISNKDVVKLLIKNGADVNIKNKCLETPIYIATERGLTDVVKLLIENGADVNMINVSYETPIYIATQRGFTDIVKILIENGADVNGCFLMTEMPINLALEKGFTDIARLLIENGAVIDGKNKASSNTALHVASRIENIEIVKLLVESGFNIYMENCYCRTPLDFARTDDQRKNMVQWAKNFDGSYNKFVSAIASKNFNTSTLESDAFNQRWAIYKKYFYSVNIKIPVFAHANKFFSAKVVDNYPEFDLKSTAKMLDVPSQILRIEMKAHGYSDDTYEKLNDGVFRLMMISKSDITPYMKKLFDCDDLVRYIKAFHSNDVYQSTIFSICDIITEEIKNRGNIQNVYVSEETKDDNTIVLVGDDHLDSVI